MGNGCMIKSGLMTAFVFAMNRNTFHLSPVWLGLGWQVTKMPDSVKGKI